MGKKGKDKKKQVPNALPRKYQQKTSPYARDSRTHFWQGKGKEKTAAKTAKR